ncbi:MAG: DUF4179 domain-containing protein, partial [Bacillota bacterium]|nr:DUF4179 domain-containing protein [Bacillota bacterium]
MADSIYELFNDVSYNEKDFDSIEASLTDLDKKRIKKNFIKPKKKLKHIAASIAGVIIIGTFAMSPVFAESLIESIPVLDSMYKKIGYYDSFKDFSQYIGISKESSGYKFTLDKIVAD